MSWLATTTLTPMVLPWMRGRLAMPAAVTKARRASTAPTTMYSRPRRGLARAEEAIDTYAGASFTKGTPERNSFEQNRLHESRADPVVAAHRGAGAGRRRDRQGRAVERAVDGAEIGRASCRERV